MLLLLVRPLLLLQKHTPTPTQDSHRQLHQVRPGAGKQVLDSAGQQLLLPVLVSIKCANQMVHNAMMTLPNVETSGVWCLDTALTIAVPAARIHIQDHKNTHGVKHILICCDVVGDDLIHRGNKQAD